MKHQVLIIFLSLLTSFFASSQSVGISTNGAFSPNNNAILDLDASTGTKGFLPPRMSTAEIDIFDNTLGLSDKGMILYNTTTQFFQYWDGVIWRVMAINPAGVTLDQAYDFGGAGLGNTIIADAGPLTITGLDGVVSTGTTGSGALAPSGAGTRMVWNPNKAAFRAGLVGSNQWDNANIGFNSVAMGSSPLASGNSSVALGSSTQASGNSAFAMGSGSIASGNTSVSIGSNNTASGTFSVAIGSTTTASASNSTSMGLGTTASGIGSTAMGIGSIASGTNAVAIGVVNTAASFGETVLGIGATNYIPSVNGATQFRNANATDRLFVVGNAIDANNNSALDAGERSDAIVILKNGNTGIGSSIPADRLHVVGNIRMVDGNEGIGKVMVSDVNGTATWTTPGAATAGSLDHAYDFSGAGLGRTITADAGAVTINGVDGFVSTGTIASGVIAPSGAGTRMVWNPNKAAFRVGHAIGTEWDDANIGLRSVAMGNSTTASGSFSTALGSGAIASGTGSTAFGTAANASGTSSVSMGSSTTASGNVATALGSGTTASGVISTAFGSITTASGSVSTAFGAGTTASGVSSTAFGHQNTAPSFGETVLGVGATNYLVSGGGTAQFRLANASDRLLVVGNAIDANNSGSVDAAERSDALVILKNGNTGIGSSTPADRLHVVGNIRMVDGNQAPGKVLVSDVNGTASWQTLGTTQTNAWGLTGNASTNPAINFVGTTDAQPLRFRVANTFSGQISNINTGLVSFGLFAGAANTGTNNTFIGNNAGQANVASANNTYVGNGAGESNVNGAQNVYIGRFAGRLGNTGSDNILIGNGAGILNTANNNVMIGSFAGNGTSTGGGNTFIGTQAGASTGTGGQNTFIGTGAGSVNTTGQQITLLGNGANVGANNLTNATAIGRGSQVDINDGFVLGSVNGVNAATSTSKVGIGTTAPAERLHVVGNIRMVDGNQAIGKILVSDANGTATWTAPGAATTGSLDHAYDFGGAGLGRTITADAGAVKVIGTDGFLVTGTQGSGSDVEVLGAGTRMFFNPKTAAFRAGTVSGTNWDPVNLGIGSTAFANGRATGGSSFAWMGTASGAASMAIGISTTASGDRSIAGGFGCTASNFASIAFGNQAIASGFQSVSLGVQTNASGGNSFAAGFSSQASGIFSTAMGINTIASGVSAVAIGESSTATGDNSTAIGLNSDATGPRSTAIGAFNTAAGDKSTSMGFLNTSASYGETVIGIGASNYIPTVNGSTQFRAANATDRLFVVGNAIDANNNNTVDLVERSDAFVILKNGNTGVGIQVPNRKFHVVGLGGTTGLAPQIDAGIVLDETGDDVFMNILSDLNQQSGILFGNSANSAHGGMLYNNLGTFDLSFRTNNNVTRMTIAGNGNVGIGTTAPSTKLHVDGGSDASMVSTSGYLVVGDVAGTNLLMDNNEFMARNNGAAANLFLQVGSGDVRIGAGAAAFQLGVSTNSAAKPTSSAWSVASDSRLKENVHSFEDGLDLVKKINPVWFTYNGKAGTPRETGVGTLAQEFQKIAPYMVREWTHEDEKGNSEGTFLAVDYGPMDFVLVNAVKELNTKLEQIQEENSQLRNQMQELMARMANLETKK